MPETYGVKAVSLLEEHERDKRQEPTDIEATGRVSINYAPEG